MASAWLLSALERMPPRSAEVVKALALGGLDRAGMAERYGISPEAADVLTWRAARDLVAAIKNTREPPLPHEVELREAKALADALSSRSPHPLATPLLEIVAEREEVRAALAKAAAEAERSPARARETWLRRLAIAVLLALTAYFFWREQTKPLPPPEPRPTAPK